MEESFYDKQVDKALMGIIKGGVMGGGKRLASEVGSTVKRMLAGGTEPFFRYDLGERYLAHNIITGGFSLWICTTIITCFTGSSIGWLLPSKYKTIAVCCTAIGVVLSGAMFVIFMKFCTQNGKRIAEFRAQRIPYHTKSRGKPRWSPFTELVIRVGASAILIIFAPVAGIAFVISMGVTANLAAEQQAAIQTAYLDALDAQIEGQFMQDALLGKIPAEITYLYQPLSEKMDSGLREDIAAAFVGKTVRMVAQAPRPKESAPANPPNQEGPGSNGKNNPPPSASGQSIRPEPGPSVRSQQADLKSAVHEAGNAAKETLSQILRSKRIIRFAIVMLILATCVAVGIPILRSIQSRLKHPGVAPVATQPPIANPDNPPPTASQVQTPAITPTAQTDNSAALAQAALEAQRHQEEEKVKEQAAIDLQRRQEEAKKADLEMQKRQEREKVVEGISNTVTAQLAMLSKFKTDCLTRLDNNTNGLAKLVSASRRSLKKNNDDFRSQIEKNVQIQETSLNNVKQDMLVLASNPQLDPALTSRQLTDYVAEMDGQHKSVILLLDELEVAISNAPKKWGFSIFKQ